MKLIPSQIYTGSESCIRLENSQAVKIETRADLMSTQQQIQNDRQDQGQGQGQKRGTGQAISKHTAG